MPASFSLTNRFDEKHVLITGGSSGIGKATAERLVAEGGRVLVTGTSGEKLAEVKAQLPGVVTLVNDEEVASVVAFLLSDEASFVTGSEYVVDGGMTET